jgi:uncharacterized protein involved in type VI secretion and phage assembly
MTTNYGTGKRYFGLVEGIVEEIEDPNKEGRIKVKFPWFDENMISEWCRVSQFYAGGGYGAFWVPEKEDEVAIAFIHGDMRQPIILGGLYNGVDKPATHRTKQQDIKMFRTKAGHEITFVDTEDKEQIVIKDMSEKHFIDINTKDSSITITSTGGKLSLNAKEIEVTADEGIKMNAKTIDITASDALTMNGKTIDGTATSTMKLVGSEILLN